MLIYYYAADLAGPDTRILDIGSKDGRHYVNNAGRCLAVDIEPREVVGDRDFCVADGGDLPIQTDSFDLVISNQVLEHVDPETRTKMVFEAARVLKPEGVFLVSIPNRLFPGNNHGLGPPGFQYLPKPVRRWYGRHFFDRRYYDYNVYYITSVRLRSALEDAFSSVAYATPKLGMRYGSEVWPSWVNRLWPWATATSVGRGLIELGFSHAAYECRLPRV